jgi:hypothetical protein
MHLAFELLLVPFQILPRLALDFLYLAQELLFLESDSLSVELDSLQLFSVLARQLIVLLLALLELIGLHLVLLVDRHD